MAATAREPDVTEAWNSLRGRPGRCGLAVSPRRSASPRCPRGRPCATGTVPATLTAARTSPAGHGGSVGHTALQVLHSLIFDFLNHRTGRLDPSYAAIAHKADVCVRTVAAALKRLRELGILNWVRRCTACAAVPRAGATGASCSNRRPTPMPCCRRGEPVAWLPAATGAARGRRRAPGAPGRCQQPAGAGDRAARVSEGRPPTAKWGLGLRPAARRGFNGLLKNVCATGSPLLSSKAMAMRTQIAAMQPDHVA
jgi:hypothetical protein